MINKKMMLIIFLIISSFFLLEAREVAAISPIADNITIITDEDTPKDITLTPGNDPLTYSIVDNPSHGMVSISGAVVRYTPASNYNGPDSFTYKANDGIADSNTATVSITVNPINDAPVADDKSATVNEDIPAYITLTATDLDNDLLTYSVVGNPSHGTVSISGAVATYTPASNYNGPDSFTFKANDGNADSNTATVSITVNPFNDAPVADSKSATVNEDTSADIALTATDRENDPLTYTIINNPSHGKLSGIAPNLIYAPSANYNGPDSFTYKANDGNADSNTATISITVSPVNDAPVATADSYTTNEDNALTVAAPGVLGNDADIDGNTLSAVKVTGPSQGTVTLNASGIFTYRPNANFNGQDSFTYKANDGTADSNVVTVLININPVNDAPVADAKSATVNEDTPADIALTATDSENDPLTYSLASEPSHGKVSISGAVARYTPSANYNGPDSFMYKANDTTQGSNAATVSITVSPVNDAPVATADSYTINEDNALTIAAPGVLGNDADIDGNTLNAIKVTDPSNGSVTLNASGRFTYRPNANFNGQDSFTYKANDGTADSNVVTVSININPVNDAPVADAKSVTVNEDTPKDIALTATDMENNPLTYSLVDKPSHGNVSISGAFARYTPVSNYNGPDSFTYKANDGTLDSDNATVSVTVNPVSDAPVADNVNITTNEDTPANITLNVTDIENDPLNYSIIIPATHGNLSGIAPNLIYAPSANYSGPDSFTYKANDGTLDSNIATVSITVNPVNDNPIQSPIGNKEVYKGQKLTFSISATDVDSDAIIYGTNATRGNLNNITGEYTWTPGDSDAGEYIWEFNSSDGHGGIGRETIKITVKNPLDIELEFIEPYVTKDNNGTFVETWRDANVGHIGKFIGYNATFKNIGIDSMIITINAKIYNNRSDNENSETVSLIQNQTKSCPDNYRWCRFGFEINSSGVKDGNFSFTLQVNVKGYNGSNFIFNYDNSTTISLPVIPIYKIKKANGDIALVIEGRTTSIEYTLEANSSVNLTEISISDFPLYNNSFNDISKLVADGNGSRCYNGSNLISCSKNYPYQAKTNDLSKFKCEEQYPCIINMATLTARTDSGNIITDTDYSELINIPVENKGGESSGGGNSGSSGGGGGGMPPGEDFNNIERREVREMSTLGGQISAYVFKAADPVMAVSFESSVSENWVPVAVEVLKNRSKTAGENGPGEVYKYFNVFVGMSGFSKKVKNGVVVYRVNNSWLKENGLDPGDIRLYKWEGKWVEKVTEIAETKPNQTYYASLTGNFSTFAIAGVKKSEFASTSAANNNSPGESNKNISQTSADPTISKWPATFSLILWMMPVIGLIGLVYYLKFRKNKIR